MDKDFISLMGELAKGGSLTVSGDMKLSKKLEYAELRLLSMQNLFNSYMNQTTEAAKDFPLKKFLGEYVKARETHTSLSDDFLIKTLGKTAAMAVKCPKNGFNVFYNYKEGSLTVRKVKE